MDAGYYIGLPYADKGRSADGLDCWGLVRLFYWREYGIDLPSYTESYASATEAIEISRLIEGERGAWRDIPKGQEREGDIIVMRLLGHPMHVGVILEPGLMLHVIKGANAVIEDYRGTLWKNRAVSILRHGDTR